MLRLKRSISSEQIKPWINLHYRMLRLKRGGAGFHHQGHYAFTLQDAKTKTEKGEKVVADYQQFTLQDAKTKTTQCIINRCRDCTFTLQDAKTKT